MQATLTVIRYKKWAIPFAFMSMIFFRLPFLLNKKINFFKLMGTGRNGTFDIMPDLNQWAILTTSEMDNQTVITKEYLVELYGKFIVKWFSVFSKEVYVLLLKPIKSHGLWDKNEVFGQIDSNIVSKGQIATLTRATIRLSKLSAFWKNVPIVSNKMQQAKGLTFSIGIGEIPWIKQATFSIWDSLEDMNQFAYKMKDHSEVIKKTRSENWYAEDMFARFNIIDSYGSVQGKNPLKNNSVTL